MIEDPLIYLVVERIKQLSSSGMDLEETDFQLNLLDYILFNENKSNRNNYDVNYITQLTASYLSLNEEDYQMIGIEANVWFLELIYDHITGNENNFINSESINRLACPYVILEHPYCRYLIMMIYSKLSDKNPNINFDDFREEMRKHYNNLNEYVYEERYILEEGIETILEDINIDIKRDVD